MKISRYISIKGYFYFVLLAGGFLASCELDPAHKEFMNRDEAVYVGKPEALSAHAGYHRNKLTWLLVSDTKINKAKIYWTNPALAEDDIPIAGQRNPGRDSLVLNIDRTSGTQAMEVMIDRLREGVYTFEVFTFDKDNNSSIRTEAIGEVYGATYQGTISNRPLNRAEYFPDTKKVVLSWFGVSPQAVIMDVEYTDVSGTQRTSHITKVPHPTDSRKDPAFAVTDTISDFKAGTTFRFRTGYLPAAAAIDTFYTAYTEVETVAPVLPDPSISIKTGSSLVRGTEVYNIDGSDKPHLILTPGIRVSDLQNEVVSDNQYAIAFRVYRQGNTTDLRASNDLIYDGDVIEFYYPFDESYKTEMKALVFADYKFAFQKTDGLNQNVTFSENSGAVSSDDTGYANSPRFNYLQTANTTAAVGGWVAITSNVSTAGKYKIDVVYKHGNRGNTEMYLGEVAPQNKVGTVLATGTASSPLYLSNLIVGGNLTTGHKFSITTMDTRNLSQGNQKFIFTIIANGNNRQIVLESVQLRFVE